MQRIFNYSQEVILKAIKKLGEESIAGFSGVTLNDLNEVIGLCDDYELKEILNVADIMGEELKHQPELAMAMTMAMANKSKKKKKSLEDGDILVAKKKNNEITAELSNVWTNFDGSFEYEIAGNIYEFPYHASISEDGRNDTIELSDKPDDMPDDIWDQVWEDMENVAQIKAYEEWDSIRGKSVMASEKKTKKKNGKKKDWDPNPWAVCNTTVDKDKDPEKFERCVQDVKKKQAFNLKEYKIAQIPQEDMEDVLGGDLEEYQLENTTKKYVIEAVVTVVDVIEAKDEIEARWLFKVKYPESANQGSIKSVKTEEEFNVEFDKTVSGE